MSPENVTRWSVDDEKSKSEKVPGLIISDYAFKMKEDKVKANNKDLS